MLPMEEVRLIAALHRRGFSLRDISRIAGHARRTVAKYIRAPETVPPRRRAASRDPLEAFRAHLADRLATPG